MDRAFDRFDERSESWESYFERFTQYLVAEEITDQTRSVAKLLSTVGPDTYNLLKSLCAPTAPHTLKLDEIGKLFTEHYVGKTSIHYERFRFFKRVQGSNENIAQFIAALRQLARTCSFDVQLDDMLCMQLICGMRNEAWQKRLLSESKLTLKTAIEISRSLEIATLNSRAIQNAPAVEVNAVNKPKYAPWKQEHSKQKNASVASAKRQPNTPCGRCLGTNHFADDCRFKAEKCNKCGRIGHIAKACRTKQTPQNTAKQRFAEQKGKAKTNQVHNEEQNDAYEHYIADIFKVQSKKPILPASYKLPVTVDGRRIFMEHDSGAAVSLVSETVYSQVLKRPALYPCPWKLAAYGGTPLEPLGCFDAQVTVEEQTKTLPLVVVKGNDRCLFGRNWMQQIKLDYDELFRINAMHVVDPTLTLDSVLKKYSSVFDGKFGHCTQVRAKLHLKPGATPVFCKARSVPFALKEKIGAELDRLEREKILTKVPVSEWATPIVPVSKPSGEVRLCGDYKISLNPNLKIDQYPLPCQEDLFAALAGGQKFSKIDLSEAYLQMELDDSSKDLMVINTHQGLYRPNRMLYGVASAPAIFQQTMDQILPKRHGIADFIDDIVITGRNDAEHLHNLCAVLEVLVKYGFKVRMEKCSFMHDFVDYFGFVINKHGVHSSPKKVDAILKVKAPTDVSSLRSFLGMVTHYSQFIPKLADIAAPLNQLLKKDEPWNWNTARKTAFQTVLKALTSAPVLTLYDQNLPVGLACDASQAGIGAVLFHYMTDHTERPIAYASKTLTPAEKNFSQIEREALSIIFGVKKFHKFLYGRKFTLITDHKPLLAIFGPKKGIPTIAASRLQRWAIILSCYTYDIEFKPTDKHGNADMLSRLPIGPDPDFEYYGTVINLVQGEQLAILPVTSALLATETNKDIVLSQVLKTMKEGWPACKDKISNVLLPYWKHRDSLTIQDGCLLYGLRVVIPAPLQSSLLKELHLSHAGIVRMKALARAHIWWPTIDADIEKLAKTCQPCQESSKDPTKVPLHHWEIPTQPWDRIHIDIAGPFHDRMWLIIVDSYSKYVDVSYLANTTSECVIAVLRRLFSHFGLPRQLVSDNGPQFISEEFEVYLRSNGIKHTLTPTYHASSNGLAERMVQSFKMALHPGKVTADVDAALDAFLLCYRTTPHATTGKTPSELMFGRQIRTRLDLVHPSIQPTKANLLEHNVERKHFQPHDLVWVRAYRGTYKWLKGEILMQTGSVTYSVQVGNLIWLRHADQLKRRESTTEVATKQSEDEIITAGMSHTEPQNENQAIEQPAENQAVADDRRYPQRNRHPPNKLTM